MTARKAGLLRLAFILALVLGSQGSRASLGAQRSQGSLAALKRELDGLLITPAAERASWGIVVKTLRGETLYSSNGNKLFVPASNMKVLTLAVAAERLGWDFAFDTRLVGAGTVGPDGLDGDLVVVGSGDPSIDDWDGAATQLFAGWAAELKQQGITRIRGRIIGDDNSFDDEPWGSGWAWDDLDRSFATGVGTLQFNQNTAQLHLRSGVRVGDEAIVTIDPPGSGLTVRNLMTTAAARTPASIEVRRRLDAPVIEIRGSIAVNSGAITRNVAVHNPTLYFVTALRDALIANGIEVLGPAADIDDIADPPARARGSVLVEHKSPPLYELAITMMRLSQNLYAETLLKTIGTLQTVGSSASGRTVVAQVLEGWGIQPSDFRVVDGSGLSVYDLVTPDVLVSVLLQVVHDDRLRGPFDASLPVAGREGTLSARMRGTKAEGNVRAKTGSLSNARALSGYLRSADGEELVFSILANNFGPSSEGVDRTMDSMLVRLAEFSRR